ncbi:hypothetical protein [Paractinoplanes toevensis]|uniref:Uncharacterized protein n=1 Tax=Paractinoplanes toevensis TaxID=571911 RepID=A0A919T850_9ACTN|nr:hypothetical protein [Actinoplanes toevensis]GIM90613.1 hypothetical protein Ato02nite_024060 [Actinoplanes toevensis]
MSASPSCVRVIAVTGGARTSLPVYDAVTKTWSNQSTNYAPLFGKSGFDNVYNNYTGRMIVTDNKLFVGTMGPWAGNSFARRNPANRITYPERGMWRMAGCDGWPCSSRFFFSC